MTPRELTNYIKRWQKRLGLQDWDLTGINVVSDEAADRGDYNAQVRYNLRTKMFYINFREWQGKDEHYSVPLAAIHELLHLHFAPLVRHNSNDSLEGIAEEWAVHKISKALLRLERVKDTEG